MNKQQGGFTLIELIMVIVILGILSAFAIPKFADLSNDAENAAIDGAAASIRSASAIAHSSWLIDTTAATVTLEDVTVTIANGYPAIASICPAAGITAGSGFTCTAVTPATTPPSTTVALDSNTACNFTYQEAAANGAPVFGTVTCP